MSNDLMQPLEYFFTFCNLKELNFVPEVEIVSNVYLSRGSTLENHFK